MADQYFEVPGGANNNNYANVTRILEIAEAASVDAVWAGWGHASENPSLPERLSRKGILFLGPSAGPMKSLGDKIDSTLIAQSAHVPTLPWNGSDVTVDVESLRDEQGCVIIPDSIYDSVNIHSVDEARLACQKLGFPLMIKASEGGGGKGIRTLTSEDQLDAAFRAVQSEVPGSPIFVMRLAEHCRHLEVQLLADEYGNVIALSGRDCSVQRRHQKIIEEGPPTSPSPDVWCDMQLAAVRLAKLVGYTNAGTVEYLYMENNTYSFLELNPRLQVEHPVTEMITNVNLPAAQLQVAMGIPLYCISDIRRLYNESEEGITPIDFDSQPPVVAKGHVIACRITAENPDAGFQPTSGAIRELNFRSTANVWGYFSVDGSGRVHEFADSQFGHLFSWGTTRDIARKNMVQALREFSIRGEIRTTIEYLLQLIQNDRYIRNEINTNWLDGLIRSNLQTAKPDACFVVLVAAACRAITSFKANKKSYIDALCRGQVPAAELLSTCHHEDLIYENTKFSLDAYLSGDALITLSANGSTAQLQVRELADGGFLLNTDGQSHVAYLQDTATGLRLSVDGVTCVFSQEYDPTILRSPNSGKLARYLVKVGSHIEQGEAFAEMEVMKMYLPLVAPEAGILIQIDRAAGSVVQAGDVLGHVQLDDSSRVRRAEMFQTALPALSVTINVSVKRPHHVVRGCMLRLQAFIAGYWVPPDQVDFCLDALLEAVKDPSLPFYEYLDVLSTVEASLPESLKQDLERVLFTQHGSDQFPDQFPARAIRQILNQHVMLAKNRTDLQQRTAPLYEVVQKYSGSLSSFAISCLFQLLDSFKANEMTCENGQCDLMRKSTDRSQCEQVWKCAFSRNQSKGQSTLLIRVLGLLSSMIPSHHEEAGRFTQVLQELALLSSVSAASVALECRQLLLQRRLPSQEEELAEVQKALRDAATTNSLEAHETILKQLVDQANDVRASLLAVLRESHDPSLCGIALECYLRKIYKPYVLFNVRRWDREAIAFFFQFSSESSELPTGIRPSASFSSLDSSPLMSPRSPPPEGPSLTVAEGAILFSPSLEYLRAHFRDLLTSFAASTDERPMNAVHIVISDGSVDKDGAIKIYEQLLGAEREYLRIASISRVTITQSTVDCRPQKRWELPTSFTFRSRLNFQEDPLVRHIEPPLAYHLELNRLRNFSIRLVPLPDRSIHLYEATPKEAAVVRGAALPRRKRFFVRAVCTTFDPLTTASITNTYPSAEKTLVEALNALEMGLGEARLRGEEEKFGGNHIFLNILPPAEVDPNLIEQIMRSLYIRYVQRLKQLHVSLVEMRLLPILTHGSQPIPVRMVGQDPTGLALRIDTYVETKDNLTGTVIFTSINESVSDAAGEWDGHSVNMAYPVLEPLERERAYAQKTSGTLYCYDFLELIQRVLQKRWKRFLRSSEASSVVMPNTLMKARELVLDGSPGTYSLKEVVRGPGKNRIGMVAWIITLYTPTYPKEGRDIVVIANDITHKAGSFGTREDAFFDLVSRRARQLGIPRIFFAANSGARIGLAEEVKSLFRVKWVRDDCPDSGVEYLYLLDSDYKKIQKSVVATPVQLHGETVYRIDTIVGEASDLGVENLAGSGLIAGETSRAYKDIVTLTVVTGRSVGIGAYLVRLGQRTIQKTEQAPIILTGYEALNQLMGRPVYSSNEQLGGTAILCPNGVTHIRVQNDIEAVEAMMQWLSYVPRTNREELLPQPLSAAIDSLDRPVTFMPTRVAYDVRHLIGGYENAQGEWKSGLFDKDSFMEVLGEWAKTVVVGRARLGGFPVGVVATENRTVEAVTPADPAVPQSEETVSQQAGGVWYPDSAFKTAQAIEDINQEGLPLFIIANWRGFSGGAHDMFDEVLKFGSYIVDKLVAFKQPVFVYIPPHSELRGGAFVVVDSHINPRVMEMYADPLARGGVLEPAGVVTIKFRAGDKQAAMRRNDRELQRIMSTDSDDKQCDEQSQGEEPLQARQQRREKELSTAYQQVAEVFADLHDRADRMKAVGVIRSVVPLERARVFFYWRLRRRLLEMQMVKEIMKAANCSEEEASNTLEQWFLQSNHHRFHQECRWENDEAVFHWMERERMDSLQIRIASLRKQAVKNDILRLGNENPYSVAEGILDLLSSLSGEVKERVVSTLKRGILLRNQGQTEFYEDDEQFIEF